jgi:hypothetical protein
MIDHIKAFITARVIDGGDINQRDENLRGVDL